MTLSRSEPWASGNPKPSRKGSSFQLGPFQGEIFSQSAKTCQTRSRSQFFACRAVFLSGSAGAHFLNGLAKKSKPGITRTVCPTSSPKSSNRVQTVHSPLKWSNPNMFAPSPFGTRAGPRLPSEARRPGGRRRRAAAPAAPGATEPPPRCPR